MTSTAASFTGTIPEYYDRLMGPAWFDHYAEDLARRLPARPEHGDVLEVACGTGLVTRRLRERLDEAVRLVATDLSEAMLDFARRKVGEPGNLAWRQADATKLPFGDARFGAVVCAFGLMFVPDRPAAFREARRVLKPGGTFLFNVWDRRENVAQAVAMGRAMEKLFPGDVEMRYDLPYSMHEPALLRKLLAGAGLREVRIEPVKMQVGGTARSIAEGQVRGTPRSLLIEQRGRTLEEAIEVVTEELTRIGGSDPYRADCQAIVVEATAA